MLFHSIHFVIFFLIVYALYRVLPHKGQNRMLLVASYVFYGSWDWRFLSLILISTIVDYICGLRIHDTDDPKTRKHFLRLSLVTNLGLLGVFKYFNFFADNLSALLGVFGLHSDLAVLNVILPVGISFYTFQTLSYTIDIYYGKLKPTRCFWDFALFVAFFPQLVAGPIERASHLLPQLQNPRRPTLQQFYEGCYLFFWGLFLKMFVADNLARLADPIFNKGPYEGGMVWIGVYAFAFQIFGDFAGYSNMARGIGKLLGIEIMNNFLAPYMAANPRDFWRRWHISLSTWLRDYLYIPLGGNKGGDLLTLRNLMLTMLLGGLWHGAAWTFVIWGFYHGVLLIGHRLLGPWLDKTVRIEGAGEGVWKAAKIVFFFQLTCIGWLIFRAQSLTQLGAMGKAMLTPWVTSDPGLLTARLWQLVLYTYIVVLMQIMQYLRDDELVIFRIRIPVRALIYVVLFYMIVVRGVTGGKEFIYFQF
ncbi:MAG: MBOAT family protein [Candidatus Omnitrophica bacterium]|nr:MBOAT family protein [Candidatus Omnitrophota bacterium]MCB9720031.1 MBOAT family protein [Candidatus Omnitrophota bacterium]